MPRHHLTTIDDIDFQKLWNNARDNKSWSTKKASDWDKKAVSFAKRNKDSSFVHLFIKNLPDLAGKSVLDIGAGPGTLSIPIARRASRITAIDYSKKMLEVLNENAARNNLTNITTIQCSWEDDWTRQQVEPHDIVIASRSLNIDNLGDGLTKICNFAKKYIFIADRISPTPFDPDLFKALGRPFVSGPDYIYTLNLLYQMGIHPNINILRGDTSIKYATTEDALNNLKWMFEDISISEEQKLARYIEQHGEFHQDGSLLLHKTFPPTWALLWWKTKYTTNATHEKL